MLERSADPAAIAISACVGIASALGVWERAGLTAADVAELGAALLALAAAARMIWRRKNEKKTD
tara:strand:+ start:504 stop:695 length:192 start_codon:yes stop_codon:yes gene_type:complete